MNNKRRKVLISAIIVFILMLLIGLWVTFSSRPPAYDARGYKEPERGGPSLVVLKNSEKLSKQLLPKQFDVAKTAINNFIKSTYGESSKEATIIGEPVLNENGLIALRIQVDDSSTNIFDAIIDKWTHYDKLIFSVPERSYSKILQVYTN